MKHIHRRCYTTTISVLIFMTTHAIDQTVTAEISYGELIDKITILTIKSDRITSPEKLKNIRTELTSLQETCAAYIGTRTDVTELQAMLQQINEALWEIEDAIRIKERNNEFDDEFIDLARRVYKTNDTRCALKKKIDIILGSHITEEKSYEQHAVST